jgi:hypothetical protein
MLQCIGIPVQILRLRPDLWRKIAQIIKIIGLHRAMAYLCNKASGIRGEKSWNNTVPILAKHPEEMIWLYHYRSFWIRRTSDCREKMRAASQNNPNHCACARG